MKKYPIQLQPVPKEIIWGGNRLKKEYNKKAEFDNIAESKGLDIYYKSSNANKLQDDIDNYLKGEEYYSINNKDENAVWKTEIYKAVIKNYEKITGYCWQLSC